LNHEVAIIRNAFVLQKAVKTLSGAYSIGDFQHSSLKLPGGVFEPLLVVIGA
jgi:hypothetical protein